MKKKRNRQNLIFRSMPNFLLKMKLLSFLIFVSVATVTANSYSQQTKFNMNVESVTVRQVFQQIEDNSEFIFLYSEKSVDVERKVKVDVKNQTVEKILDQVFEGTKNYYEIHDRQIAIMEKGSTEKPFFISKPSETDQQKSVAGKVIDSSGASLPGVSVVAKGTTTGVITDANGYYSLSNLPENAILQFSFVGMKTQEIAVGNQTRINVTLEEETFGIEEVVAVGYGTQRKGTVTGAVSSINSEILTRTPQITTSGALVGKVQGVNARQTDGRPGGTTNIQIRNMGDPLYVIDGVPADASQFNNLSTVDIESISILKDASAAIYGFRAANGVILVTTKKGNATDKTNINVNGYKAYQNWTRQPTPPDAYTYMLGLARSNQALGIPQPSYLSVEELAKWKQGTEKGYISTDYYDFMVRPNAPLSYINANASGGGANSKFYFSVGHLDQDGLFKMENGYKRTNFQANLEAGLAKGLKFIANVTGRIETRYQTGTPSGVDYFNHFFTVYQMLPTERPYANDNPLYPNADVHSINVLPSTYTKDIAGYKTDVRRAIKPIFSVQYDLPFGLTAKGTYAYDYTSRMFEEFDYSFNTYHYNSATDTYETRPGRSSTNRIKGSGNVWGTFAQMQLNYNKKFGDHTLAAVAAYERSDSKDEYLQTTSLPQNNTINSVLFSDQSSLSNSFNEQARAGYIGKVNYNYKNKYLVEALGRYDGSYLYAKESRWGFFPAISIGWKPLEESFTNKIQGIFSDLKVRASYGETGSEMGITPFGYLQGYDFGSGNSAFDGALITGVRPRGLPVTSLSWVTNISSNIGVDFAVLDNKLSGTVDLFERKRTGLPAGKYDVLLPLEAGYTLPNQNLNSDAIRGLEGILTYTGKDNGNGFSYSVSGNATLARRRSLSTYKPRFGNSWDEYKNSSEDRWADAQYSWGYHVTGRFQSMDEINNYPVIIDGQGNRTLLPGDFIFQDLNGDKIIDALDQRPIAYPLGGSSPLLNFGLNSTFNYKGFSLELDFAGASLFTYERRWEGQIPMQFNGAGIGYLLTDAWHQEDPYDANSLWIPGYNPAVRRNQTNHPNFLNRNDFWFINVFYTKLKNLQLSYNLPKASLKRVGIEGLTLYVQGTNLFSLDNVHKYQIDPEIAASNAFVSPQQRLYVIGFNINL